MVLMLHNNFFRNQSDSVDVVYQWEDIRQSFLAIDDVKNYENLLAIDVGLSSGLAAQIRALNVRPPRSPQSPCSFVRRGDTDSVFG